MVVIVGGGNEFALCRKCNCGFHGENFGGSGLILVNFLELNGGWVMILWFCV